MVRFCRGGKPDDQASDTQLTILSAAAQRPGGKLLPVLGSPRGGGAWRVVVELPQSGEHKSSCDAPLMAGLRDFEEAEARGQRDDLAAWQSGDAFRAGVVRNDGMRWLAGNLYPSTTAHMSVSPPSRH
jgi:hypothetical protein